MNDTEKLNEIYARLVDLSARISVLKCLDTEMLSFPDCVSNGSHKTVILGISLIASDLVDRIDDIYKIFNN